MGYVRKLLDDHAFNPLHSGKYSNKQCICDSGKKVKKCCGIEITIKKEEAELAQQLINEKYFGMSPAPVIEEMDYTPPLELTNQYKDYLTDVLKAKINKDKPNGI